MYISQASEVGELLRQKTAEHTAVNTEKIKLGGQSIELLPPKKGFFDLLYETLSRRAYFPRLSFGVIGNTPIEEYAIYLPKYQPLRPCRCCFW